MTKELNYTEKEIDAAGLTDSELAALNDTDEQKAEETPVVAEDAPEEAPETKTAEPVIPEQEPGFIPEYTIQLTGNRQGEIDSIAQQMEDVGERLDNGEITAREFQTQNIALMDKRSQLMAEVSRKDTFNEINTQNDEQLWQHQQDRFFAESANQIYSSKVLYGALNASIQDIARELEFQDKSNAAVLVEADRRVRGMINTPQETLAANSNPVQKDSTSALDNQPTVESSGEFAHIESMDGLSEEAEVSRMNPDQLERYLAS